ncbi:MAG: hypothetical protein HPY85_11385 [Anaerolineae bacterium]|nr:hypothetical protein [Anaerolineae bacterium]
MPDMMICSFCNNEVNTQLIACPHCGNHFHTTDDARSGMEFHPTRQVQVPFRWLMIVACAVLAAGSLMPWGVMDSMLGRITIRGAEGDGVLTAGIAALLLVVAILPERASKNRRLTFIAGSVLSGVILIPKLFWFMPDSSLEGSGLTSQLFPGLVLASLGVLLTLLAALVTQPKNLRY